MLRWLNLQLWTLNHNNIIIIIIIIIISYNDFENMCFIDTKRVTNYEYHSLFAKEIIFILNF